MFRWWGPKDNKALLLAYYRRGARLHRKNLTAMHGFAQGVIADSSNLTPDFIVRVSYL